MNPIARRTSSTPPRAIVPSAPRSTGGGGVAPHTHSATAIVSGELPDDRLPTRLQTTAPYMSDLDTPMDTGFWSADTATLNTPAASFWLGQTVSIGFVPGFGDFRTQIAHERDGAARVYHRSQIAGTWTAWVQFT